MRLGNLKKFFTAFSLFVIVFTSASAFVYAAEEDEDLPPDMSGFDLTGEEAPPEIELVDGEEAPPQIDVIGDEDGVPVFVLPGDIDSGGEQGGDNPDGDDPDGNDPVVDGGNNGGSSSGGGGGSVRVVRHNTDDGPIRCDDMDSDFWGYDMVNSLIDEDIYPVKYVSGDYICRVETELKRQEFTVWLLKAYQEDSLDGIDDFHDEYDYSESPFHDVDGTGDFDPYIIKAAELDIISGYPDGYFRGSQTINRAEVLKILLRSSDVFMNTPEEIANIQIGFPDSHPSKKFVDEVDKTDAWYVNYLHYSVAAEIIVGRKYTDNGRQVMKSDMGAPVLYGEAAKILYLAREVE